MADAARPTPQAVLLPARSPWTLPRLSELPKLTSLTLASAIGGGGGTGSGGSTVFGLLIALLALGGCTSDRLASPSDDAMPAAVTAVTCTANVQAKAIVCGGPLNVASDEIIGGQGTRVILRSRNVDYTGTDFSFEVQVQNVGVQTIGTDGNAVTGVRVFFEADPIVTSVGGTAVNMADSTGTFTAIGLPYYVYTDSIPTRGTSAWVPWHFAVTGVNTTFTFEVLVSAQVPTPGALLRWEPVSAINRVRYTGVVWSGGSDAMAVGERGLSSRWNGTTWRPITPVTDSNFIAVAPVSQGVYLAVANGGKIFKFSKNLWTEVYVSPTPAVWNKIWARNANHWYAVGDNGAYLVYNNGTFTEGNLPGGVSLDLIAGTASGSVTMLASQSTGTNFVSTSGGAFVPAVSLIPPNFFVSAIAYDASGALIKARISLSTYDGEIIRTGALDSVLYAAPYAYTLALWPFPSDSLVAPIMDLSISKFAVGKVRFGAAPHDFAALTPLLSDPSPFDVSRLNSAGTNFALINNPQAIVTSSGGGPWTLDAVAAAGPYVASWGQGDSVWVIEGSGELWKIVDGVATQLLGVPNAVDIWGFSGDELYIVAGGTVFKGNGVDPWATEAQIDGGGGAQFRSIWGEAASGTLIVPASSKRYMQRVGGVWSEPVAGVTDFFKEVWGCSSTQAWMVGVNGHMYNWTPTSLIEDPEYSAGSPLLALSGTDCDDVWAGGPNSKLFHWDGGTWDQVAIGGAGQIFISALAAEGTGIVYVGGQQSQMAMVNANGTSSRMLASNQWDDVKTLWRLDDGDLFVGGQEHAIFGRR